MRHGRGAGEPGAGRPRVYPREGPHDLGISQEALQDQTGQKGRRARARREQALGAPCELSGRDSDQRPPGRGARRRARVRIYAERSPGRPGHGRPEGRRGGEPGESGELSFGRAGQGGQDAREHPGTDCGGYRAGGHHRGLSHGVRASALCGRSRQILYGIRTNACQ